MGIRYYNEHSYFRDFRETLLKNGTLEDVQFSSYSLAALVKESEVFPGVSTIGLNQSELRTTTPNFDAPTLHCLKISFSYLAEFLVE